ncbi:MAG: proline racemase family protein [Myxococcota bacterium]
MNRIRTIDAHTAGEPLRIITAGWPDLPGDTILQRRAWARENCEPLRRALMWEPRGHADMYGALLVPPATPDGDLGVLFLHNEGYSTMCGHGIIALTTVVLDRGLVKPREPDVLRIDTPAGRVVARARRHEGRVEDVTFRNVASFVQEPEATVEVPQLGTVRYDLAFGGAYYAYVDATALGLSLQADNAHAVIEAGRAIKRAIAARGAPQHPDGDADLGFLYGTIFVDTSRPEVHSRNACVFAEGELDRSPTGTGVSGRVAIHHARGELPTGQWVTIESILGTSFDVRVLETTTVGGLPAVVPEVRGAAFVTGEHEFIIDPRDPLRQGFLLR